MAVCGTDWHERVCLMWVKGFVGPHYLEHMCVYAYPGIICDKFNMLHVVQCGKYATKYKAALVM